MSEERRVVVKRFDAPDETVELPGGARLDIVRIGGFTLARGSAPSGWHWAEALGSTSEIDLCPHRHVGMILSGSETIRFPDGEEVVLEPGDVYLVQPGHDSWISSGDSCVSLDLLMPESGLAVNDQRAEANKALVRSLFEAFNAGDTETLLAAMAPDFVMHLAEYPGALDRHAWREGFEMMRRAFPDLEARVEDTIAADDRVAVRITLRATHRGEFQGIPATGREVQYVSHEIYRVEDGLVAEEWVCSDTASLFRRLTAPLGSGNARLARDELGEKGDQRG